MASPAEAVADIPDGATLSVGGFGLCGVPIALIGRHVHAVIVPGTETGASRPLDEACVGADAKAITRRFAMRCDREIETQRT